MLRCWQESRLSVSTTWSEEEPRYSEVFGLSYYNPLILPWQTSPQSVARDPVVLSSLGWSAPAVWWSWYDQDRFCHVLQLSLSPLALSRFSEYNAACSGSISARAPGMCPVSPAPSAQTGRPLATGWRCGPGLKLKGG